MALLQIFENQRIYIGKQQESAVFTKRHLKCLGSLQTYQKSGFFSLGKEYVQFHSCTGILQLEDLTIEILPKLDKAYFPDIKWQEVLIDMLLESGYFKVKPGPKMRARYKSGQVLPFLMKLFLEEVQYAILPNGLLNKHEIVHQKAKAIKGRFLLNKHLSKSILPPTHFELTFNQISKNHWINCLIWKALSTITQSSRIPFHMTRSAKILLSYFPKEVGRKYFSIKEDDIINLPPTLNYLKDAIQLAYLITQNNNLQLRSGPFPAVGILLPMSQLFESFIAAVIQKAALEADIKVTKSPSTIFWNQRRIKPDLLLQKNNQQLIIDIKWKDLNKQIPSIEDLRQVYVYSKYFDAPNTVLLYPRVGRAKMEGRHAFAAEAKQSKIIHCQILMADILSPGGGLLPNIGKSIIEQVNFNTPV